MCASVNWQLIEAVEERDAQEVRKRLAEKAAEIRRNSHEADTVYANGTEGLRAILAELGAEPKLIDEMVEFLEYTFRNRWEEARVGRRKVEASLKKARPGRDVYAVNCARSNA